MLLKELTNEEFTKFRNSFNIKSLYQSVEYANVMSNQDFETLLLGLIDENNNILAASLILVEKNAKLKYSYAPRGFLINYNDFYLLKIFTEEIKKYLSRKNIVAIKICPSITKTTYDIKYNITMHNNYYDNIFYNLSNLGYKHLGYSNLFESLKPRYEAIIKLNVPYYILFKNIRKEIRTKIRGASSNGVKVYKGDLSTLNYLYLQTKGKYPRDLDYYKEIYLQFSKTNSVEFFYTKLDTKTYLTRFQNLFQKQEELCNEITNDLIRSNNPNNKGLTTRKMEADFKLNYYKKQLIKATNMLRDYPEGVITSSALVIKNNDEAFLLIDGYDSKYKIFNSKHLLIWKLCERYSNFGFKEFNLGGITNINLDNNPYNGLNKFKLGFNSIANEYMGDLELITNNTLYFMYKNSKDLKNMFRR